MSERKKSGIYAIVNRANQKSYVGQAISIGDRWLYHLSSLRRGKHSNIKLQRAWAKYGPDAFSFKVLEYVEKDRDLLARREQFWIDLVDPAYNIAPVAGSSLGVKHPPRSDEFRKRMGDMKRGTKPRPETIELLRQIAKDLNYRHTPEIRARISAGLTGKKKKPETIEKHRQKMLGRKQPPEEIARRAASLTGKKRTPEQCARIAESIKGKRLGTKQSAETIEKRAAALRGRTRPQHIIDTLHAALAAKRQPMINAIRAALIADPDLNQTHLADRLGCGRATIRKQKALLCQQQQQNASESDVNASPLKQAELFKSP